MRALLALPFLFLATASAGAQQIVSEYTDIGDTQCSVFAIAGEGDGDWANLACSGYKGYPVLIYYGDAREFVFYGFPPGGDLAPAWESFSSFNSSGPRIEWRIERDGDREMPFATIHRWFVTVEYDEKPIEVLVVEKVAQIHEREGCAVGYVVATGNANANEKARNIADGQARDFACGDQPAIDSGSVPVPPFHRSQN